ncbi:hypothetical protein EYF80_046994 [Liparis tanakae]|uniref:Uncharacterized protein n=1 Tax=Liparis tanakae TaxID=230148 RepID=A0A4Z2FPK2_9TELE|nr:hypothetical protein EYF80_046994 [Liparis tanakae]
MWLDHLKVERVETHIPQTHTIAQSQVESPKPFKQQIVYLCTALEASLCTALWLPCRASKAQVSRHRCSVTFTEAEPCFSNSVRAAAASVASPWTNPRAHRHSRDSEMGSFNIELLRGEKQKAE